MFEAVLLDIDNTLLDFNLSAGKTIEKAFGEMELVFSDKVFDAFLQVNNALWLKIERGEITREELHRIRWKIIFEKLGINADGACMEALFLKYLENFAVPVEGAVDLVKYLSGKYAVYTASNAPYSQQVKRLTDSGIIPFVDGILEFEAIGVHKPQKRFFEECLRALYPVPKERIALIGDSLSADMKGGKSVGITTIWFNHDGLEILKPETCDYAVKRLSEIKNIL